MQCLTYHDIDWNPIIAHTQFGFVEIKKKNNVVEGSENVKLLYVDCRRNRALTLYHYFNIAEAKSFNKKLWQGVNIIYIYIYIYIYFN